MILLNCEKIIENINEIINEQTENGKTCVCNECVMLLMYY